MSITINAVMQSGIVKWPALRYDAGSRPEFRFVLYRETQNADGHVFPLSIPCCSPGSAGERLAEELNEGDFVVVTVGELVYRRRETKEGEKSRLEILVWRIQKDDSALSGVSATAEVPETASTTEPRVESKKGKARYPKWKPSAAVPSRN
jgi:hypothetical protein